jgi:hypothetical protein
MVATQHSKHHQNSGWFKGFLVGGLMTIICVFLFNNVSKSSAPYSPALKYSTESGFIVGVSRIYEDTLLGLHRYLCFTPSASLHSFIFSAGI